MGVSSPASIQIGNSGRPGAILPRLKWYGTAPRGKKKSSRNVEIKSQKSTDAQLARAYECTTVATVHIETVAKGGGKFLR